MNHNRASLYKKVCTINVKCCLSFAFVRNRWSSRWTYTILTRTASCARQKANRWTSESLWWHPVNCTGGIRQQQPGNKKVLLLKVWATFQAANHRLWLVHVALSPERPSVRLLKLQLQQGATNLKRTMKMNCKTSLFDIRPFWSYCKYLFEDLMLFTDVIGNYSVADHASLHVCG